MEKIILKSDNDIPYMQGFGFYKGIPSDIEFEIERYSEESWRLTAPGYGVKGDCGNGALFVKSKHICGLFNEKDNLYRPYLVDGWLLGSQSGNAKNGHSTAGDETSN